ncbi:hypothetical protein JQN58_18560 [Aneurinibacillus sp. BA2021]|nr:hypothetical protein [Aneurinibacillus sp. BA2021]
MKKMVAFTLAACVACSSASVLAATGQHGGGQHGGKGTHTKSTQQGHMRTKQHGQQQGHMHTRQATPQMPKTGAGGASEVE